MAPASSTHGAIQNETGRLLANHLAERMGACRVITAPGPSPGFRPVTMSGFPISP